MRQPVLQTVCQRWVITMGICVGFSLAAKAAEPEQPSGSLAQEYVSADQAVLNKLFDEQHVFESGIWVCEHVSGMSDEDALNYLLWWVLPQQGRSNFRIAIDYAAAGHDVVTVDSQRADAGSTLHKPRIVSPAIELVRRAEKLGKIELVRDTISSIRVETAVSLVQRQTLLIMLAIAAKQDTVASEQLDEIYQWVEADPDLLEQTKDSVLLCASESLRAPNLTKLSAETLPALTQRYRTEYVRTAWHRHLWAVAADAQLATSNDKRYEFAESLEPDEQQWIPVSVATARERGSAFPEPCWVVQPGSARSLSSCADDFLYFRSPLAGKFAVEAHATGFGYQEAHLMLGGWWTGLVYNHRQFIIGNVRGELERQSLDRELADTHRHGFIHTRLLNDANQVSTFFNGHSVHQHPRPEAADPWIAIRSMYRVHGGVDDLRISGSPTVPKTIEMVDSHRLRSWFDYFYVPHADRNPNRLGPWQGQVYNDNQGNVVSAIASRRSSEFPAGSNAEELLIYTRPVLEDGLIEYEFLYSPNQTMAFPCVGGIAFLISESDVKQHRVTDGIYDRSPLRPDNVVTPQPTQRLQSPSLKPGQWNRMTLRFKANTLTLNLNGQDIYETELDAPPLRRHFGLFHFADQTSLLVRNATWQGTWPKAIPPIDQQTLVAPEFIEELLDQSDLPDRLFHRFDDTSLNGTGFAVVEGDPVRDVRPTKNGLEVIRKGRTGYQSAMISRPMTIQGDFDVTVQFDQLERFTQKGKIASVRLWAQASSDLQDTALIQMVHDREADRTVQCLKKQTIEGKDRRHYFGAQPMEATSGRLRLSRRKEVMYYLVAENDSDQFRIIGKQDFSSADLNGSAVRFGVQVQDPDSLCKVRFQSVEIAAESSQDIPAARQPTAKPSLPSRIFQSIQGLFQ